MTNELMNAKVAELRALEAVAKELEAKINAVKDELKAELDTRQVDSVDTGLHNIFYQMYEKASVDTAKLKEAGLYEAYSKKSTIIQFKVTDKKAS